MFKIDLPSINFAESRKVYRNPGENGRPCCRAFA